MSKYRTPIVAVLGHVDHGKTSLLDAIRETEVQAGEEGGITQNTRAHKVRVDGSDAIDSITFIDTPGHEAFTEMRSRGARIADIAMLVVAADDGVQPQTEESIEFIKKQGLPVVVACNKIDLPGANPDKVKQELSSHGILVEDYGGEAIFNEVSATEEQGLDELLESIALVAELQQLERRDPVQGEAEAFVLESQLNSDLGAVSLVISKAGHVEQGQYLALPDGVHKVRATLNEAQQQTQSPSQGDPVWVIGIKEVLAVGENLTFFEDKDAAEQMSKDLKEEAEAEEKQKKEEEQTDADIFAQLVEKQVESENTETNLKVILHADTRGTLEAIEHKIEELSFEDAKITVFRAETGDLSESDIELARDIGGIVLGFQVKVDSNAETLAKREKILVRTYKIIYNLIDELEAVVHSMVEPEEEIEEVARAEVKQVFTLTNGKQIAGCVVTKGTVIRGYKAYVERDNEEMGDGKITSLKHLKEDVKEAKKGTECGIMIEPEVELQEGDAVVCYKVMH